MSHPANRLRQLLGALRDPRNLPYVLLGVLLLLSLVSRLFLLS